jgi:starch synthase
MVARVLFATPEVYPINQVGGLADVSASLTGAMKRKGLDVRLVLPGYDGVKRAAREIRPVLPIADEQGREGRILQVELPEPGITAYVVDFPTYFKGLTSPYAHDTRVPVTQASRFLQFARGVEKIARGDLTDWQPEVVHCNDWTTGLIPVLLAARPRPATVFTIHNLAYQGLFPRAQFELLGLPESLWSLHTMEFHGQFSLLKGGLVYADVLNTVSHTYAREILTSEFGCGLDGLLRQRQDRLSGILNGVDYSIWNPATDRLVARNYDASAPAGKAECKRTLQRYFSLDEDDACPLFGVVSRLTDQKGIDLIVAALDRIVSRGQLVLLGTGDKGLEQALVSARESYASRIGVCLDYDDVLAHQIVAGSDVFLMPSRFEPCGLTQLYALKYGAVPVVHRTGGLADTVVNATAGTLASTEATGISYRPNTTDALADAIERVMALYGSEDWAQLRCSGMRQDFSWERSAAAYLELYGTALDVAQW